MILLLLGILLLVMVSFIGLGYYAWKYMKDPVSQRRETTQERKAARKTQEEIDREIYMSMSNWEHDISNEELTHKKMWSYMGYSDDCRDCGFQGIHRDQPFCPRCRSTARVR